MKQIEISENVYDELNSLMLDKETFNLVIQRLIHENKSLKQDKIMLMKIALQTEDSIALSDVNHASFFAITEVLKDSSTSDDEKIGFLKIYLKPSLISDTDKVLSMIASIKSDDDLSDEFKNNYVLDNILSWIKENYQYHNLI